MGEFQNGTCGCLGNFGLCIFTMCIPCYTQGKLAESVGDDCLLCGLALIVPLLNIYARVSTRGKVRENKGIEGGVIGDLICVWCCPICSLMQEAQEMGVSGPLGAGESLDRD